MANSVLEFIWKIGERSVYYTTVHYRQKLKVYGSLQSKESSFDDFIWAFLDRDYKETMCVANNVLYHHAMLGDRGRPEDEHIRKKIQLMIKILNKDTCPDIHCWEGHPCIPKRVFGPKEDLVNPPWQLSKPRVTSRPLPAASGGMALMSHRPQSEFGSFKVTRTPRYGRSLEPKVQEDTARKQFIAWFDTACANLDSRVKHRALLASKDASLAVVTET